MVKEKAGENNTHYVGEKEGNKAPKKYEYWIDIFIDQRLNCGLDNEYFDNVLELNIWLVGSQLVVKPNDYEINLV